VLSACLTHGFLVLFVVAAPAREGIASGEAEYRKQPGPLKVASFLVEWNDTERDRQVPAKIYHPRAAKEPFPIVIFSHGLGGSREGYSYLGRHWSSHGYVSVHLEHEGSDAEVWRGQKNIAEALQRAAKEPENSINRPKDVSFAIDQLTRMNAEAGPLRGRLALDRIGVAGHSFGAFTALAVVGEAGTHVVDGQILADPRVKAALPMSPPVPRRQTGSGARAGSEWKYETIYGNITVPCLHMTGTLDEMPNSFTKAADRRIPYDHIDKADQYLIILEGGTHRVFSGRKPMGRNADRENTFQDLIRMSTLTFLDAYLKQDPRAKTFMQTGGLEAALGKNARLEHKPPASRPAPEGDRRG